MRWGQIDAQKGPNQVDKITSDWQGFLEDFHRYWPTDAPHTYVCFIREDPHGRGKWRTGERSWLRLTERWTATAKSVFGFGVQGEVATSTHAGLHCCGDGQCGFRGSSERQQICQSRSTKGKPLRSRVSF